MFNLKRILSLSLFASLLGSASTFAGGGPVGPGDKDDKGRASTGVVQKLDGDKEAKERHARAIEEAMDQLTDVATTIRYDLIIKGFVKKVDVDISYISQTGALVLGHLWVNNLTDKQRAEVIINAAKRHDVEIDDDSYEFWPLKSLVDKKLMEIGGFPEKYWK